MCVFVLCMLCVLCVVCGVCVSVCVCVCVCVCIVCVLCCVVLCCVVLCRGVCYVHLTAVVTVMCQDYVTEEGLTIPFFDCLNEPTLDRDEENSERTDECTVQEITSSILKESGIRYSLVNHEHTPHTPCHSLSTACQLTLHCILLSDACILAFQTLTDISAHWWRYCACRLTGLSRLSAGGT